MKRILLAALCAVLLPGCLASIGVQVGNTGVPAPTPSVGPGGSFSSSGVSARVSDGSSLGALLGMAALAAVFGAGEDAAAARQPPALDQTRTVHEQDCTRAPEQPAANLRCR